MYLIVSNSNSRHASFVNSTNRVAAGIHGVVSDITEYINLRTANEALSRDAKLPFHSCPMFFYIDSVQRKINNDTVYNQQYTFMTAKVINNSTTENITSPSQGQRTRA